MRWGRCGRHDARRHAYHAGVGPEAPWRLTNPLAGCAFKACVRYVGAIASRETLPSKLDGKAKRLHTDA
ncbi:hypothetical protein QT562_17205 [Xanthomonas citri pv. citri]|uniref:hypothetical protein n=1 Tax=Xanthomonas TaxID=338 RepID=UPI000589B54C|nr:MULTISPECIES: hypothetical protein [Xanthomonas]AUZ53436.1 hypothetical protein CLM98_21850 [Xanthomonas citri pv. citri]OLR73947.1 hypothetical protein BI312_11535 [Xanthomonas citri pv. citri]OLR78297.1 hypothetical protein BI311_11500 [Xanthomonas citri pv. citri]PWE98408.1 hypothetical protein TP48_11825 [Xanthomonas citri pv. citri]PWF06005.1 hypothetical protein TP43_17145 [Xanthomonas citri pv. citri]